MNCEHRADLPALDELGSRLEGALAERRGVERRQRRGLAVLVSVVVLVAAPAAAALRTGLFGSDGDGIEQVLPATEGAIELEDPVGSGRELERRGFEVRWILVQDARRGAPSPTVSRQVPAAPRGTRILSVLGPNGGVVDSRTRRLTIEVAPAGSEILRSHGRPAP